MQQYKELLQKVLDEGTWKSNRTGIDTLGIHGAFMQFDVGERFPIVTLKKTYWKPAIAEMLGFFRGYDNAEQFRKLGCNVWDQNANENKDWLANDYRKGEDDLGRIYGVQARKWIINTYKSFVPTMDQLKMVYVDLKNNIDNRREIVTHWNPSELNKMSLPPCHLLYQFGIEGEYLNLSMYQRSADLPLGVPFNIVGYSWLLSVMAHITGLKVGNFNHFLHDVHIYKNQLKAVGVMLDREPIIDCDTKLIINDKLRTFEDIENKALMSDFIIKDYNTHEAIKIPMAV